MDKSGPDNSARAGIRWIIQDGSMPMTTGRKILVIKHGALGDIVQALDGFASLRAGHKDEGHA